MRLKSRLTEYLSEDGRIYTQPSAGGAFVDATDRLEIVEEPTEPFVREVRPNTITQTEYQTGASFPEVTRETQKEVEATRAQKAAQTAKDLIEKGRERLGEVDRPAPSRADSKFAEAYTVGMKEGDVKEQVDAPDVALTRTPLKLPPAEFKLPSPLETQAKEFAETGTQPTPEEEEEETVETVDESPVFKKWRERVSEAASASGR